MRIPPNLKEGDQVAIVATAKRMEYDFQAALDTLTSWGLEPVMGKYPLERSGYFAGTDQQKIEDLQWALDSPEIKAIVFLRGGYGTTRILDAINFDRFKDQPKWMVGYSDLTSMILQADVLRVPMIHGPMCYTLGKDLRSDDVLKALLFGQTKSQFDCHGIHPGEVEAKMVGGNLSMVYESIGAENEIDTNATILFLEDVGEQFYSVDRMMNKLRRVGKLDHIQGVILGSFTNMGNVNDYFSENVEELILSYLPTDIPIATGLQAGHDTENLSLIMNRKCQLQIGSQSLEISYL
jgi:muramoyltetrapeptide carboxypeptidase